MQTSQAVILAGYPEQKNIEHIHLNVQLSWRMATYLPQAPATGLTTSCEVALYMHANARFRDSPRAEPQDVGRT
jgi:hypothetical protein